MHWLILQYRQTHTKTLMRKKDTSLLYSYFDWCLKTVIWITQVDWPFLKIFFNVQYHRSLPSVLIKMFFAVFFILCSDRVVFTVQSRFELHIMKRKATSSECESTLAGALLKYEDIVSFSCTFIFHYSLLRLYTACIPNAYFAPVPSVCQTRLYFEPLHSRVHYLFVLWSVRHR